MGACGARRDGEKLVESEDAGFAAFPACSAGVGSEFLARGGGAVKGDCRLITFLPLVEDGRARVVDALFVVILVRLLAAFVHALFRHGRVLLVSNDAPTDSQTRERILESLPDKRASRVSVVFGRLEYSGSRRRVALCHRP